MVHEIPHVDDECPKSDKKPEKKVTASTVAALLVGIGAALLNSFQENPDMIAALPPVWQGVILAVVPPLAVFVGGYAAKHTPRATPPGAVRPTDREDPPHGPGPERTV